MHAEVEAALQEIRPALETDGGGVELVDIEDGVVRVKLTGACGGCPMSQMTMSMGVERVVRARVPEIKRVVAVRP